MKKLFLYLFIGILLTVFISCVDTSKVVIEFESNGGTVFETVVLDPNDLENYVLPIPEKEGSNFIGWFTDKKFSNRIEDIPEGIYKFTLYAKWEGSPQEESGVEVTFTESFKLKYYNAYLNAQEEVTYETESFLAVEDISKTNLKDISLIFKMSLKMTQSGIQSNYSIETNIYLNSGVAYFYYMLMQENEIVLKEYQLIDLLANFPELENEFSLEDLQEILESQFGIDSELENELENLELYDFKPTYESDKIVYTLNKDILDDLVEMYSSLLDFDKSLYYENRDDIKINNFKFIEYYYANNTKKYTLDANFELVFKDENGVNSVSVVASMLNSNTFKDVTLDTTFFDVNEDLFVRQ